MHLLTSIVRCQKPVIVSIRTVVSLSAATKTLPIFATKNQEKNRELYRIQKRFHTKDYDKVIKLEPEDITFKYNDSQFLPGPSYSDEPYVQPTDDEIVELTRVKLEKEVRNDTITKVDPNQAPFNEVLEGYDDGGKFTQVESIGDDSLWRYVDRLMPRTILPPLSDDLPSDSLVLPISKVKPNKPYYIGRTRSHLFPLYRKYQIVGRNKKYWQNRWDGLYNKYHTDILQNMDEIKFENNEKTITLTSVTKITGDIWAFEQDARHFLESKRNMTIDGIDPETGERILSSVNEVNGVVEFKGDFIQELYTFLKDTGF